MARSTRTGAPPATVTWSARLLSGLATAQLVTIAAAAVLLFGRTQDPARASYGRDRRRR